MPKLNSFGNGYNFSSNGLSSSRAMSPETLWCTGLSPFTSSLGPFSLNHVFGLHTGSVHHPGLPAAWTSKSPNGQLPISNLFSTYMLNGTSLAPNLASLSGLSLASSASSSTSGDLTTPKVDIKKSSIDALRLKAKEHSDLLEQKLIAIAKPFQGTKTKWSRIDGAVCLSLPSLKCDICCL